MTKYKKETLIRRLNKLEDSLQLEDSRLNRVIDNMGWGRGMRCTKCTPSFRKQDELKEKIEKLKLQLNKLDNE